jgi:hypothetical protein
MRARRVFKEAIAEEGVERAIGGKCVSRRACEGVSRASEEGLDEWEEARCKEEASWRIGGEWREAGGPGQVQDDTRHEGQGYVQRDNSAIEDEWRRVDRRKPWEASGQ